MTLESAFIFFISLALLWIKPGPGQALKITRALNDGFLPALYLSLGILTICMSYFIIAALGLEIVTNFFESYDIIFK
jgi:threonine/homoserine/homoserine lactone efflux protein